MPNPLYQSFGNYPTNNQMMQFIQEVRNFRNSFKGNPKDEVQRLLQSGQMSQAQFNQYAQIAGQISQFMK